MLPLHVAQVRSLVRELRSFMPSGAAKKKKKDDKLKLMIEVIFLACLPCFLIFLPKILQM